MSAESSGGSGGDSGSNVVSINRPRREAVPAVKADEQLLTVKDVVFWTKGSKSKIYEASRTGALKAILLWGNRLRFRRADVLDWLNRQTTPHSRQVG